MLVCVETELDLRVRLYFSGLFRRLEERNFVSNPFTGQGSIIEYSGQMTSIVVMTPIYPNPLYFAALLLVPAFLIRGLSWWLLPGLLLMPFSLLWSSRLYFYVVKFGLRRAGYTGFVRWVTADDAMMRVLGDG